MTNEEASDYGFKGRAAAMCIAAAVTLGIFTSPVLGDSSGDKSASGTWSKPVELVKADRSKVVTIIPYGVFRDGKTLYAVFLNILRAGNRMDLTIRRSMDDGKTWQPSFSYALYSVDILSNLVMKDGRLRGMALTKARELQFLSVDVRDDFYKVTPITAKGGLPAINPYVVPSFLIHNERIYFLFADKSDSRSSGLHLLESRDDGATWTRRAGPPTRHRGHRAGRLVLFASRALVHALVGVHVEGAAYSRVAHYVQYDRAEKWYTRGGFTAPGAAGNAYAYGGVFDGESTMVLFGKSNPGGRTYGLYSSLSRDKSATWSDAVSAGAPIFHVHNEFTSLRGAAGRFALFGTRFDEKKDVAPAIRVTDNAGLAWRDISFGNEEKTSNFMVTGLLAPDGAGVYVNYVNTIGDPETGELRIMFRRWSEK